MNGISSVQLVKLLIENKRRYIEASMNAAGFKATHMLVFGGRKIFDTGIDSQETVWEPKEFIKFYPNAYWLIEQIV